MVRLTDIDIAEDIEVQWLEADLLSLTQTAEHSDTRGGWNVSTVYVSGAQLDQLKEFLYPTRAAFAA